MFLIAKGLGFLSRGKAAEKVCGVALTERRASLRGFAPASLPWAISSFLGGARAIATISASPQRNWRKINVFRDPDCRNPALRARDLCIRGMELWLKRRRAESEIYTI